MGVAPFFRASAPFLRLRFLRETKKQANILGVPPFLHTYPNGTILTHFGCSSSPSVEHHYNKGNHYQLGTRINLTGKGPCSRAKNTCKDPWCTMPTVGFVAGRLQEGCTRLDDIDWLLRGLTSKNSGNDWHARRLAIAP